MCSNLTGHSTCNTQLYFAWFGFIWLWNHWNSERFALSEDESVTAFSFAGLFAFKATGFWMMTELVNLWEIVQLRRGVLSVVPTTHLLNSEYFNNGVIEANLYNATWSGVMSSPFTTRLKKRCTFSVWRKWHNFAVFNIFVFFRRVVNGRTSFRLSPLVALSIGVVCPLISRYQ